MKQGLFMTLGQQWSRWHSSLSFGAKVGTSHFGSAGVVASTG